MGKIQVDHTGAGGGITLSSDGTDLLLDGIAVATVDQVGLVKGADIGATADLDDYITDGYFHQNGNAASGTGTNYPIAYAGMLSVQADGNMVYQKYQTYNGWGSYQRTKYNSTWYAWDKILDTGNVDADIDTLSLPANTTISAFGATLVDDASAAAALTTLGAQPLATVLTNTTASFLTADETKLDAIEALADVTDADNVVAALDGATLDTATVAATDLVITKDVATGNLQTVTAQSIADLGAGGGAALDLYAENPSSPTAPSATGANAVAIGSGAKAASSGAIGLGPDSWARSDSTFAVFGDAQPSSIAAVAIGVGTVASGAAALALGRDAYGLAASSISLGKSRASGADSLAAAITSNTATYGATGANSVAIGYQAKATSEDGKAIGALATATGIGAFAVSTGSGSFGATASGAYSIAMGRSLTVSGQLSFGGGQGVVSGSNAIGWGFSYTCDADHAVTLGSFANAYGIKGRIAFGNPNGYAGKSAAGQLTMSKATTDATPAALASDGNAGSTNNQVILPNNSAFAFHGTIVARQQAAGTACAAWKIEGLIRREGSAGTTVLVNSATTVLDNTPAWGMALTADTTNGGLKIEVTGAAATNIRWVATINTSEVTY